MTLKQESRDALKAEMIRRVEKLPKALGLDQVGITREKLGIDDVFLERMIDEAYLGIFTVEEVEEMVEFSKRFSERAIILEKVIEEAVGKVLEANKETIIAAVEEGMKA